MGEDKVSFAINITLKLNLAAIKRIIAVKYQRGAAFNRQHPFVDVLLADITESGEVLNVGDLAGCEAPPRKRAR